MSTYQYVRGQYTLYTNAVQIYQESDGNGNVLRYADFSGNTISLPTINEVLLVNPTPPNPYWAISGDVYVQCKYLTRTPQTQAYIELNRFTDLSGNTLNFQAAKGLISSADITDFFPPRPNWGT